MPYVEVIKAKIRELEQAHSIHVLFACESGSRAWGFPSPDSDYDARFIYMHPKEWYLSIHEKRDVVELPVDKLLDINGWDLRKTLRLIHKHNAVIYEWIQSPIVYRAKNDFVENFQKVAAVYFSPKATLHHYLSSAVKYYAECTTGDGTKLKKLLYCLRVTLAALWVGQLQTVPPMELDKLLQILPNPSLVAKVKELVLLKSAKDESYLHPREPDLELFLKNGIVLCESAALTLPGSTQHDEAFLNAFLRDAVK